MNISEKKNELIKKLSLYVSNRLSAEELLGFAWDVIDYFNKNKKNISPEYQSDEKEFWYTIWQIQHLCDDSEIENDKEIFKEALEFLMHHKKMPLQYKGERP